MPSTPAAPYSTGIEASAAPSPPPARRAGAAVTNEYRRRSLKGIVNSEHPAYNFDDVHRSKLDEVIAEFKLDALTAADRDAIWRTWHALDAWPDFVAGASRLRKRFVVASFTLLTTSLVIDVSKRNGIDWDAIISCEMIGIYKTRPEAYRTAAKWLQLEPAEIMMVACHNFDLDAARACRVENCRPCATPRCNHHPHQPHSGSVTGLCHPPSPAISSSAAFGPQVPAA